MSSINIVEDKENEEKLVLMSLNYEYKIRLATKMQITAMSKSTKHSSSILFRELIKYFITDPLILANANSKVLTDNNTDLINACRGIKI